MSLPEVQAKTTVGKPGPVTREQGTRGMWMHVDTCGYRWIQVDTCGYMWIHVDTLKTLDRGAYITIIQTMLQSRGSSNTIAQPFKSMVPEYQRRTRVLQQEYGPFGQNEEADQD